MHRQLGCGFLESVYQEALALELTSRDVPYSRETRFPVLYKGHQLASRYRPDFICFGSVVVELKALGQLSSIEESQLLNYLKVTGCSNRFASKLRQEELRATPLRLNSTKRRHCLIHLCVICGWLPSELVA